MHFLYQTPWHRIPAFLVGMALPWGLDYAKRKGYDRTTAPKTLAARVSVILMSTLAVAVLATLIILPVTNYPGGGNSDRAADNWSQFSNSLYMCFSRLCWAIAVGVLTLACFFDYLPLVNAILSHWLWKPLAKLTFGAYLLHPIIIAIFIGNAPGLEVFTVPAVLAKTWWYFTLAYFVAAIMYCVVERPFATLRELLVPANKEKAPS